LIVKLFNVEKSKRDKVIKSYRKLYILVNKGNMIKKNKFMIILQKKKESKKLYL